MDKINVVINGILGKMGQEVANAVSQESDMCLSGGVDITAGNNTKLDNINVYSNLDEIPQELFSATFRFTEANVGTYLNGGLVGPTTPILSEAARAARELRIRRRAWVPTLGAPNVCCGPANGSAPSLLILFVISLLTSS